MTDQIVFQPFNRSILDRCVAMFIDTFSRAPWNDVYESRDQVVTFFENHIANNYFLGYVLMAGEEVIALCIGAKKPWINGMEYYIDQFCVSQNHQGQGIGGKFLGFIEDAIRSEHVNAIILMTDKGFPSERFYLKNGFKALDEIVFLAK